MLGLFDVAYGDGRNFFRQLKGFSSTSRHRHCNSTKRRRTRAQILLAAFATAALSGCSVHPIPDDLPPGIPTEEIVKSARCEMRLGLFDQVKRLLREEGIADFDVSVLQTQQGRKAVLPNPPPQLKTILAEYGEVAVAYDFNFEISEHDNLDASLAFKLPFAPNVFDLGAAGSLRKTRIGKRTFSSQETFYDLILRDQWCGNFEPRDRNLVYPITGSIGLRKVVETFMALSEQGGGKDSFVDALTFTTTISGSVNPSVKLNPVPDSFRLVNASAGFAADRTDLHQVKISLAFPVSAKPKKKKNERPAQPDDPNGPSIAPYAYNPVWRARYNICVADARDREDTFKTLRLSPPEVYCLSYADAFVPRTYAEALLSRSDFDRGQPRPDLDAPAPRRGPEPPLPRSRSLDSPLPRATEPLSPQPRSKSWW